MTALQHLFKLPHTINYVGYTFSLQLRGDKYQNIWLGYFLTGCHSKNRYKKQAYACGVWHEKERVVTSSMGSNYLFKCLANDDTDKPIEALINHLKTNGLPLRTTEIEAVETEFEIINYNLI